ncbi:MAG: endonuclease I, partial [Alteromonas stellipolaris]
ALIDDTGNVIQFLSYEGTLTATSGAANGLTSTDIGVSETSSTSVGYSLQLSGSGQSYDDFSWQSPASSTADSVNNNQSF